MKKDTRSNHDILVWVGAIAIAFATLACQALNIILTDEPAKPAAGGAECLPGILPGQTTREETLARLGNPLATNEGGALETLSYGSAIFKQLNSVVLQNGVVVLVTVIQPVDHPLAWSEVKQQNGEPAYTAYTNYSQGSRVYAFPSLGRAFTADEQWDAVFIQQCFVPMSLENYILVYGNFLPMEDPFIE
jgi:hypothetical protein